MATRKINDRKLRDLHGLLQVGERAKLVSRAFREGDNRQIDLLRKSVPQNQRAEYLRQVSLLLALENPIGLLLGTLLHRVERDNARLHVCALHALQESQRVIQRELIWSDVSYPITESEFIRLSVHEREQVWTLDHFAAYMVETNGASFDVSKSSLFGLGDRLHANHATEQRDDKRSWCRTAISAAVRLGELPQPRPSIGGVGLPWGVLHDWLFGPCSIPRLPFDLLQHVEALAAMGGALVPIDIQPDSRGESVRRQREKLITRMARLTGTDKDELALLDPHLPEKLESRTCSYVAHRLLGRSEKMELVQTQLIDLGCQHQLLYAEYEAYEFVISDIAQEEFGGEDPLMPEVRLMLERVCAELEQFRSFWPVVRSFLDDVRTSKAYASLGKPSTQEVEKLIEQIRSLLDNR